MNLFDGGPRSTVAFRVGGLGPIAMERRSMPDPHVQELVARNAAVTKPWVKAVASSHLWVADLPDGLGAGTHTLTETATDTGEAGPISQESPCSRTACT